MLDWTLIDNDRTFQRLINHLFALECNSPGFIPSSPYIGADGSWDGAYTGYFDGLKGRFSIQAKWTKKSFNDAMPHLTRAIKEEIKKALNTGVDHLRIATNAELRKTQVDELEKLKVKELKSLFVWYRENLTLRIEKQAFIRYYFFGKPQFPAFVPANIYMDQFESKLLMSRIFGRSTELTEVKRALSPKDNGVIVLHSPGGHGKSHFLKVLSEKTNKAYKTKQVWFIRPCIRSLRDAFQDELVTGRNYVLFLDDADRYPEEVKTLISLVRSERNIKVVLSSRSAGLSLLKYQLLHQRYDAFTTHQLSTLPEAILVKILCKAAGRPSINKSHQIVAGLNFNPYLIVQYGRRLKGDIADDNLARVYDKLNYDLQLDTNQILGNELDKDKQIYLLAHLATIVPFQISDVTLQKLSQLLDLSTRKIRGLLEKLISGKILRTTGDSVRFDPDMMGDLLLSFELGQKPSLAEDLIDIWFPLAPSRSIANIASTFPYGKIDSVPKVLEGLVNRWINQSREHGWHERTENLKNIRPASTLIPSKVINLIYAYLSNPIREKNSSMSVTLDDYGPLIQSVGMHPDYQIEILELVRELAESDLDGHYDNYKTDNLMKNLVSPISKAPVLIEKVLNRLLELCESQSLVETEARLAMIAASEILASAHEFHELYKDKFTIGEKPLRSTPQVEKLRDIGLKIYKALIDKKDSPTFQILGLEIAESIGTSRMGQWDERRLPLGDRIARDRRTVLQILDRLPTECSNFEVLSKLEDLLFRWWAQKERGADRALKILPEITRPPEYRFFKRHTCPEFLIEDLPELLKEAPKKGIWNWWWDHHADARWNQDTSALVKLAQELCEIYRHSDEILKFLIDMSKLITPYNGHTYPPVIRYWVDKNPEPFVELSSGPRWDQVPIIFKGQISSGITKHREEHISEVEEEILSSLPDAKLERLHDFVSLLLEYSVPYSKVKRSFLKMAEYGSTAVRGSLIDNCYFLLRGTQDKGSLFEIIHQATKLPLDQYFFPNLAFCLHASESWPRKDVELEKKLKRNLESIAAGFQKLKHYEIEILDFCLGGNIDSWLQFLENRFDIASGIRRGEKEGAHIEALPYDGIKSIKNWIKSYSDFSKVIDKVDEWDERVDTLISDPLKLLTPLKELDFEKGKEYFAIWMKEKLSRKNQKELKTALKMISIFGSADLDEEIYYQLLETGLGLGMFEITKSAFRSLLGIGYSFVSYDIVNFEHAEKRKLCQRIIHKSAAKEINFFLRQCVKSLEKHVQNDTVDV